MILSVKDIHAGYGPVKVLGGLNFGLEKGEIHCLMGRNGAGKTTLCKAIMGLVRTHVGSIHLNDARIDRLAAQKRPQRGIGYVPQGRRLFADLSVAENLEIGLLVRKKPLDTVERVLEHFPKLRERLRQRAGTLSGGEQQMLATARALCLEPEVLILDEPSEGLQPSVIALIHELLLSLAAEGTAVMLVEHRVAAVLSIGTRVTFIDHGRDAATHQVSELTAGSREFARYVGVG